MLLIIYYKMDISNKYNIYIQQAYDGLKSSGKEINNYDLGKIFEYYSCIQLSKKYKQLFYEYNDIDPTFKEQNKMTRNDTGIDACNLIDTIVQCKLRKDTLRWEDCGTFFGSQNIFNSELKKTVVRWDNLIITRNKECKLSKNLKEKHELYTDITFSNDEIISYCDNLIKNPPKIKIQKDKKFKLRYYQSEAINIINNNKNVIISLPTGCGKNIVIIYSMNENKRYLILVPRIILMEQIKKEIIKHKPEFKNQIQTIGDNHNKYDQNKNITICVYNSVSLIEKDCNTFDKIFIDEAHHINVPEIYENEDDDEYYSDDETESSKDDTEDEIKNTTGFNKIIKSLSKHNNNVYLSATIDIINDFTYYKKEIRDMIDKKYLSDYTIHIPIFSDDPTNKNICQYLIKNYRNIIVYCNSQKEGKKINELLNSLQKGCSEYIDCNTSKINRKNIVKSYKKGQIPFLVNVRILVEGFDAPITKGVCFIHLPSSKTTIIQIIGRALRLHPLKTFANIILPFSSKDDETNISKFLKILAQNDKRIKKSYESKTQGGYISIEKIKENDDEIENNEIEFRYEIIYDNMGILKNGEEIWMNRLEQVKKYIDKNKKRPSTLDKNLEIKKYGQWINNQQINYSKKEQIMKNQDIRKLWKEFINDPKYKEYLLSNEEEWKLTLNKIKKYIDENKKRPSSHDKNLEIKKYGQWISHQQQNYSKNEHIMKNQDIKKLWEEFINDRKYKKYFISNKEEWKLTLNKIKKYIDENNKRPSGCDKNLEIKKYGCWISDQQQNYSKNEHIMKNQDIRKLWKEFINDPKYKEYFLSNVDDWKLILNKIKKYIDENNKRPSQVDKNLEIKKYGQWISNQQINYSKNEYIMKNQDIKKLWEEFINDPKYKKYFLSNEEEWKLTLNKIKKYIDENKKRPSKRDKNLEIKKYGQWISNQQINYSKNEYIMKNQDIKKLWKEFINDPKYKKYF
jgi:mevalonate pyrophosphate decarboxylase